MAKIKTFAKPTLLYRYRPLGIRKTSSGKVRADPNVIQRELQAIEEHYVFCPTYRELNDPMEGLYASTQRVREKSDYQAFVQEVQNEKLGVGIAAFCETWDNELMWAHYAEGFRGICVAYSLTRLTERLDDEHSVARIAYGDRPLSINLAGRNHAERAKAILSTKNLMWTYEREWRLFAPTRGEAHHGPGVVKHVYLGARMASEDRKIVTNRLHKVDIEVRRTHVDGYSIERFP